MKFEVDECVVDCVVELFFDVWFVGKVLCDVVCYLCDQVCLDCVYCDEYCVEGQECLCFVWIVG